MGSIVKSLIPVFEKAKEGSEFKIISYNFQYKPTWSQESEFYKNIESLLTDGIASFKLLGGMPIEELYKRNLENLHQKGAEIRILEEPPTSHLFIRNSPKGNFIWFELYHENDVATTIANTSKPSPKDINHANNYFDEIWKKGTPFK